MRQSEKELLFIAVVAVIAVVFLLFLVVLVAGAFELRHADLVIKQRSVVLVERSAAPREGGVPLLGRREGQGTGDVGQCEMNRQGKRGLGERLQSSGAQQTSVSHVEKCRHCNAKQD